MIDESELASTSSFGCGPTKEEIRVLARRAEVSRVRKKL
jgi:hypothetical protein